MRIIPTRIHGMLDYLMGVALISLPFVLNWDYPENLMLWILGGATIALAFLTRYELGFLPVIPMAWHLALDFFVGAFLVVAPFAYSRIDAVPGYVMMALGIGELLVVLLSKTTPGYDVAKRFPFREEEETRRAA